MLRPAERYWATKPALLRLLAEVEAADWCQQTLYLAPSSSESGQSPNHAQTIDPWHGRIACLVRQADKSETGLALFLGDGRAIAIAPPFPVSEDRLARGVETSRLVSLMGRDLLIGVVLLRLGRYAVGLLRGDDVIASKTGTRYVKSRHRAGGSSQRRFERSRERLIRELFDKTCDVVTGVFSASDSSIDHVLIGGEPHTIRGFVRRCRYMKELEQITLKRLLQVDRPGQRALNGIASEVWKSRVQTFAPA